MTTSDHFPSLRNRSLFIAWGGSGGFRGGSAVIDRRKGGIRPNNCSCCSGSMRRKYHYRYHLHIETVICRWLGEDGGGGIMTCSTTDKGGSLKN